MRKHFGKKPYFARYINKAPKKRICTRVAASGLSLLICAGSLTAPTYAFFSDSVVVQAQTITSAYYDLEVSDMESTVLTEPVTLSLAMEDLHYYVLKPVGTASTGYCKVTVRSGEMETVKYISPIPMGSAVNLAIQAAKDSTVTFEPIWGAPPADMETIEPAASFARDASLTAWLEFSRTPYIEYTVTKGTTLANLSNHYSVSQEDILLYNGIDAIEEGMTVLIPNIDPANAPEPYKPPMIHIVAEGETLSVIAEKYGITIKALCMMNDLLPTSILGVGQELVIPNVYTGETQEPVADEPTVDEPTEDEPSEEEPSEDEPSEDEPIEDEPSEDEPAEDEPTVDEPAEDEPNEDEPSEDEPSEDEPSEDEPSEDEPSEDEPTEDEPPEDEPPEDEPAEDEPSEDEPTEDEPSEDEPIEDEPSEDEPTEEEPSEDEPSVDEPSEDEPSEEEPSEDEPTEDEPSEEEPTEDEPTEDESIEEESSATTSDYSGPVTYKDDYVPLYYQDDYPDILYGQGTVKTSGCSVTSLAMVATAMTGHEYLPDELADYFGDEGVNNMDRLERGATALQLPWQKSVNWDETWAGLQEGKIAIALMEHNSLFTNTQHFIVLTGINEAGKIMVNDSQKANYDNWQLQNAFENGFTVNDLLLGYSGAWLFDPSAMPEDPYIYSEPRIDRSNLNYPDITLSFEERELLAKVIWVEAQGECAEGQQAIAEVVFNRMRSSQFSDTLNDVIYGEGQFRCIDKLEDATPWAAQYRAIDKALHGTRILPDNVVYFASFKTNENVWGVIGNHIFCYE